MGYSTLHETLIASLDASRVLVVSNTQPRLAPSGEAVWLRPGENVAAGADEVRYDLAIVDIDESMQRDSAALTALLAELRDRRARRVAVTDSFGLLALNDMLALGFERWPDASPAPCYLFDPDSGSRRREWNTPENWANPENFDKYRW